MYTLLPLTPLFTIACTATVFLVWRHPTWLEHAQTPWVLLAGVFCGIAGACIALVKPRHFPRAYDLFCLGTLLIWFVHWREVYRVDAPVFAWYPIFFDLMIVLLTRQVIHQARLLDPVQQKMLRIILGSPFFQPWLLIPGVLLSVWFSAYYLFYPILISLVLIRCSFGIVVRESGSI
ncbi:MAG: hypothetical protein ACU843_08485 [Gammaproteobacteria bacterium]